MRDVEIGGVLKVFGERLRLARNRRGISQEELAHLANLHRTYICDIERGSRNVTIASLFCLAKALKTTMSELVKNVETASRTPLTAERNP
jgi:transcriptional regulator with XRE-family HTH domain